MSVYAALWCIRLCIYDKTMKYTLILSFDEIYLSILIVILKYTYC